MSHIKVGNNCIVGTGAVVIKDGRYMAVQRKY
ncbi:MAG: hypothetical protein IJV23_03685 [Prevotella sp.]|nr:hypothetical protein [Prevotella sp.]